METPFESVKKWVWQSFPSGTQIVKPIGLEDAMCELPYLYIYGTSGKDEDDTFRIRCQICIELKDWLNGGTKPKWFDDLKRVSETELDGLDGTSITAVGLWKDIDPPNCCWVEDDGFRASNLRAKLIDFLVKKGGE